MSRPNLDQIRQEPKLWLKTFVRIEDHRGRLVPFVLNDWQSRYYDYLKERYWKPYLTVDGGVAYRFQGIREVNVKCRDIGASMFICGLFLWDTLHFKGTKTMLYAQDEDFSKSLLNKPRDMFDNMATDIPGLKPETGLDNPFVITFPEIRSEIRCSTPGSTEEIAEKQGRSTSSHNLLMTEFPFWPQPHVTLKGILGRSDRDANVFIESTGKHINDALHEIYLDGQKPENIWTSHFWLWLDFKGFSDPIHTENEEKALIRSITSREQYLIEKHDATLGQIKFRRRKIDELRSEMAFRREYPEQLADAFQNKGNLFFSDPNLDFKVTLTEKRDAIPGHMNAILVDVGGGVGQDYSTIHVVDCETFEEIYSWSDNTTAPEFLHLKIYEVWKKYPGVIGIESNNHGRTVIAMARNENSLVKNEKGESVEMKDDWNWFIHCGHSKHDGIYTSHGTKPIKMNALRRSLREAIEHHNNGGTFSPDGDPIGLRLSCEKILEEMNWFIDYGDGKMQAPDKKKNIHDDHIDTIALFFQLIFYIEGYRKEFNKRFGVKNDTSK